MSSGLSSNDYNGKFKTIDDALKRKELLNEEDINNVLLTMINRKRFKYTVVHIIEYLCKCLCCRNFDERKNREAYKLHYFFDKCEELLTEELDVVSLMKQARQTKLLS